MIDVPFVDVRGKAVALYLEHASKLHYEPKPQRWREDRGLRGKVFRHYQDDCARAGLGRLTDASMNELNEIEAGYCVEGGITWLLSTAATPDVAD